METTCMATMTTFSSAAASNGQADCLTATGHLQHPSLQLCQQQAAERLQESAQALDRLAAAHGRVPLDAGETWRLASWADRAAALVTEIHGW